MRYISVDIYKPNRKADASNGGVSSIKELTFVVPCDEGPHTEDDLTTLGAVVLVYWPAQPNGRQGHFRPARTASGTVLYQGRQGMFGGCFVWSTDSRFRAMHPAPVPLNDRFE